jgi:hypothetical protein
MSYIGNEPIVSATRTVTEVTATAGQTVFTANGGYTVGFLDVFINGSKLTSADFTATNGTTVTLTEAAQVSDIVRLEALGTFLASNGVAKTGDTMTGQLTINGGVGVSSSGLLLVQQRGDTHSDGIAITSSNGTSHRIWKNAGGTFNIGNSSGQVWLGVDTSGRVTTPYQPALVATVTSNKAVSFSTSLAFDSIALNRGNHVSVSLSNSRFTVSSGGYYKIDLFWFLTASGNDSALDIKVNGSTSYRVGMNISGLSGTASNLGSGAGVILNLAANDYIEIFGSGSKTILKDLDE